jgi:hypothetical protein
VNEQCKTLSEAWDGQTLKLSFRMAVGERVMNQWYEVVQIANSIQFSDEPDTIICQFNSMGKYSVQSLYVVMNNRGVKQVYTSVMWKISIPLRLHIFLWLLANNKTLTRDNLDKRKSLDDKTCLFCSEPESMSHLFSE